MFNSGAIALFLSAMSQSPSHSLPLQGAFDLYEQGIRTGEYVRLGPNEYSVRRRNRLSGEWQSFDHVSTDSLDRAPDTRFPGAVGRLSRFGKGMDRVRWHVGRRVRLTADDGRVWWYASAGSVPRDAGAGARYWSQIGRGLLVDGTAPLDLVIGPRAELIAAGDPGNDVWLVRRGRERSTPIAQWTNAKLSPARYGITKLTRQLVRMSDGVLLAADVYLPAGPASTRFPTILMRTPYGIGQVLDETWHYVARGYAVVAQDVRGRGASQGEWKYTWAEPRDGKETLDWIVAQPWSDGAIGMIGSSYVGQTQWMAAMSGHPALRAIIPIVTVGPPHVDMPYTGGAFTAGSVPYVFSMCGGDRRRQDWGELLMHRPLQEIDQVALGKTCDFYQLRLQHSLYDEHWAAVDWLSRHEKIDVPALHISGWYDDDLPGTLGSWAMMAAKRHPNQRLILGPWRHGINRDREINGVTFGATGIRPDLFLIRQLWYDRFLKKIDNDVESRPKVEYYQTGAERWRTAESWPPPNASLQAWYFRAAESDGRGALATTPPTSEAPDAYQYDPAHPTPSRILRHLELNEQSLPDDYSEIEARSDVLVYTSNRLRQAVDIAGNIRAVLFASSSARDTDWIVRLTDVDTTGRSWRLVEGVIRARHRASFTSEDLLTPGKVERYEISMRGHAHRFRRGHRIRVTVASAALGYIFPNSNTGENEATVTRTTPASQRVYHDADHPSHILLPVQPAADRDPR